MSVMRDLPPDERRHFYRRVALAPLCLCLVAGLHVIRVLTARQTPWKGGGFGMFSTIDSESRRFLRAYLLTADGELPLPLPEALDKPAAEVRAAPSRAGLEALARRLAAQDWRWTDDRQRRQAAAIADHGGVGVSAAALAGNPCESPPAARLACGQVHALEPIPRAEARQDAVAFHSVRVECWRLKFAAASGELRGQQMLSAVATRPGGRP
jgi:hypothetical protein